MSSTGWCLFVLHKSLKGHFPCKALPSPLGRIKCHSAPRPQRPALPLEGPPWGLLLLASLFFPLSERRPCLSCWRLPEGHRTTFPWVGERKGNCCLGQGTVGAVQRSLQLRHVSVTVQRLPRPQHHDNAWQAKWDPLSFIFPQSSHVEEI